MCIFRPRPEKSFSIPTETKYELSLLPYKKMELSFSDNFFFILDKNLLLSPYLLHFVKYLKYPPPP